MLCTTELVICIFVDYALLVFSNLHLNYSFSVISKCSLIFYYDLVIPEEYKYLNDGGKFHLGLAIDGTFSAVTTLFAQLFAMDCRREDSFLPMAYALLPITDV
ncbi:hypothetical protein T01_4157 [Trichinella spiralis]|uniref:Uncharacterized protein n=1 Tax=Trichinella spiralis TaxID=6334 RepID=A0A0V1AQI9_TRISP|nr:hypothetical protein T01_4157 [Trichinella spiralis]